MPISSSFTALSLKAYSGTSPNVVTHGIETIPVSSLTSGANSILINEPAIITALQSGTTITPSLRCEYGNGLSIVEVPGTHYTYIPPPPLLSLLANGVTIKYNGDPSVVQNSTATFIYEDPRGTGPEWFAIVKNDMKSAIKYYANGVDIDSISHSAKFIPPGQTSPVPLNNIVTTLMTNMDDMFVSSPFNLPINSWDTSNVTTMFRMFGHTNNFNKNIGSWDTSKVTKMGEMFFNARAFDQDISNWNISSIVEFPYFFSTNSPLRPEYRPNTFWT
jgi:surface protein